LVSIAGRAVNELFFRKVEEFFFTEKGRGSFEGSDSGKGPARSALSLVFNGIDGNSGSSSPVNIFGGGRGIQSFDVFGGRGGGKSEEHSSEFLSGQVHEFGGGHFIGSFFVLLVSGNNFEVFSKNRESILSFSISSIDFSVGLFPVVPGVVDGGGDSGGFELVFVEHEKSSSNNGGDSK
jgi:hypothetical protein